MIDEAEEGWQCVNDIEWMDGRTCLASVGSTVCTGTSLPAGGRGVSTGQERKQKPPRIVNQSINQSINQSFNPERASENAR